MDRIRVLLVDDHVVLREGVAALMAGTRDMQVVGQAGRGVEAVRLALELEPDALVLDYSLPDGDGTDVLAWLRAEGVPFRALFLSMHENPYYARKALAAGAAGFLVKSAPAEELLDAVRAVHAGRHHLDPTLGLDQEALVNGRSHPAGIDALSQREFQVLRYLGEGRTLQQTAKLLQVSDSTASTYRARLMGKLDLRSTAQIIRFAIEQQIVG